MTQNRGNEKKVGQTFEACGLLYLGHECVSQGDILFVLTAPVKTLIANSNPISRYVTLSGFALIYSSFLFV